MIIKFNPEGRVVMVFGRKKEASDEGAEPWKRVDAAASARRRPVPPADRRHLGHAGQHLHQRRLHQFARRQVRQERRLGEAVGRAGQRDRASSTRRTASRPTRRATSTSPTAATAASRCSIRMATSSARSRSTCRCPPARSRGWANPPRRSARRTMQQRRAVGDLHHAGSRHQYLYSADAYPGPHLQADARRQGARRARHSRAGS